MNEHPETPLQAAPRGHALDASVVTGTFGYLVRRLHEKSYRHFNARFADLQLNPVAYAVMAVVSENTGARQGQVAAALGLQESNMASMIKELMARGLIHRVRSSDDRRAFGLALTPLGDEVIAVMKRRALRVDREQMRALSPAERRVLLDLLSRLQAAGEG